MQHLTPEQIARYASRSGDVDEIIGVAQHFEVCAGCRDRAAAILDPGTGEVSHVRKERRVSGARPALAAMSRRAQTNVAAFVMWVVAVAAVVALLMYVLLRR
jgi:hypothetical protein